MHELISNILGSSSDEIVAAPLQLKPVSLATLELVYSQLISKQQFYEKADNHESTPVPEDGSNLTQIVAKLFNQKSRKTPINVSPEKNSLQQEVNDFWALSSLSNNGVTQSMLSASTSILLSSNVVRNTRVRLGVLSNIWKNLKPSSHTNNASSFSSVAFTSACDENDLQSSAHDRVMSAHPNCGSPTLADIGCQTAFTIAVSFLKSCWRSTPTNMDLCSDVLSNCVSALSNLSPGSLHSSSMSVGVVDTLVKARDFLISVARNSLPGVSLVPDIDRQYAVCILLYFAFAEGSLSSLLDIVSLIFELSYLTSNGTQTNCHNLQLAPIKPILLKLVNQIKPQYLNANTPAAEVIRKSGVFEQSEENFPLDSASMLLMASLDCLVQPLLSTYSLSNNSDVRDPQVFTKTKMMGWGISELIAFGSHNIELPGAARVEEVVDMTASQYFLVVLMSDGNVCQLPMCDLSPEIAATVIAGSNNASDCVCSNKNIISIAACPTSTNCLALSSNGQVFYWDAAPTDREPPKVEQISLLEVFINKVAAGFMYQAALSTDGMIYIWGRNQHGQLGTGSHQDELLPVQIAPIRGSKWVDVSLSASAVGYTVAVTESGHVYSWGGGSYWRLGHGASFAPLRILSLEDVVSVFAGDNFTAACTKSGKLEIWGRVFGDNQMPHEIDLLSATDSVKALSQNSNRLMVVTTSGKVLLYGRDFSRNSALSDTTSTTSFLDDPSRPRVLAHLDFSIADEAIKVRATCTPLAGFVLITTDKKGGRYYRNDDGASSSLTTYIHQSIGNQSASHSIDVLLELFCLAIKKRDQNLCVFVIDIFRAHSTAPSSKAILHTEQKAKFQICIFELCSSAFAETAISKQQALCKTVEAFVTECWSMLYSTPEDRLAVLLKLVRSPVTCLSETLFRNVVDIVIRNGDLGKFVNCLIQSETLTTLDFDSSLPASDTANSEATGKKDKFLDNGKDARRKNLFTDDSANDLILLITTIVMNDRRRIVGRASEIDEVGLAISDFYRITNEYRVPDLLFGSSNDGARLVSQFLRHTFAHIFFCSCAGSEDGCPATSICRGVVLIKDFVRFFCSSCHEIISTVLRLGKMSPTHMLYACHHLYKASLMPICLPEIVDSFLSLLLFAKHHFIGSDNGRPLGLFLINSLQPLSLALIEMDSAFSHFEQWLDCYAMSWQSALPTRTLHQRYDVNTVINSMRNTCTIVHGCILDIADVSSKDLAFLNKEVSVVALRGRETTPVFMTSDIPVRELHQKIRCFITRYGVGRITQDDDDESSPMSFSEGSLAPPFRDVVQSVLFAISLFSVDVMSQEPSCQFPEELIDLIHSGIFRSSLVSDFDSFLPPSVGDFISSLSGQRPNAIYSDAVEKLLAIFDCYLTSNNMTAVKNSANENVALRAVKRYSLAAFVRHMDVAEPTYNFLVRSGDGNDITTRLPIVSDCFRSVASILQHIVKQFQLQVSPTIDHSSVCSPVFFALRFLLNSVDSAFDFSSEITQRMAHLRKKSRWRRALTILKKQPAQLQAHSKWDDVVLLFRDPLCCKLYRTWRFGLLDENRLIACAKLTKFVQFAKISQITEMKLRFRMHIELAICQTETTLLLADIFNQFSSSNFVKVDVKSMPHLLEAFLSGLSFASLNHFQCDVSGKIPEHKYSNILSRKSERSLVDAWEHLTFKLIDAIGLVAPLFSEHLQLSLLCPIVLYLSGKFRCPESSTFLFMQSFLARLIRVLATVVDQNAGERLKTIAYPRCLVFERKVKEKKYRLDVNEDDVGPEMAQRLTVGSEVVRGPHWCWGDQDSSGSGGRSVGIVLRPVTAEGWVRVRWANGISNNYRMGRDGRYDLRLAHDDNSTTDNVGSANEIDDDDDRTTAAPFRCRSLLNDTDEEQEEDEEFHSIESGAESVVDDTLEREIKGHREHTTSLLSKKLFQPLISLLTASGQKFLQNLLISSTSTKSMRYNLDSSARRFLDFLLRLYEQFWSMKQHELAEGGEQTMTSLTLSGADICFRDIYGFSLLHELAVNPLFACVLAHDVSWLNLLSKVLKQIETSAYRMHPHFFIAIHVLVIVKNLFSKKYDDLSDHQGEAVWSLFLTIYSYLTLTLASSTSEPSHGEDNKVPLSATYSETIILHTVDCLRRIYANVEAVQKNMNNRIHQALVSYSLILDSLIMKSNKPCSEQDFAEVLPLLAFMGVENEGRPYCGAEVTSPVEGYIQLILPKGTAVVLVRSNGTQTVRVALGKLDLKPITQFQIVQMADDKLEEPINLLVLKHIGLVDYLDRLLLLAGVDASVVTNTKKSSLFMSAKLFMQFVSSAVDNKNFLFTNATDFVYLIKAAARSTTVRPKYSPFIVQTALTPLIDVCRHFASSPSNSSASLSLPSNQPAHGDHDETGSVQSIGTLQTLSIATDSTCKPALNEEGELEEFSAVADMDDSDVEDAANDSHHKVDEASSSDDDTVTTIECGEHISTSWDPAVDEELPAASSEDDSDVRRLVEMGFSRTHIYEAYASLLADVDSRAPSLDTVVNWLIENPSLVDESSGNVASSASGNRRRQPTSRPTRRASLRRSLGRFLSSTLVGDDGDDTLSLTLIGATSSSTSNEEGDDNAVSSSEERSVGEAVSGRLRPPLAAFGRAVRRDQGTSPTAELVNDVTPTSDICVGQIVKSLTRVDKVVFGETGYVLRVSTPSNSGQTRNSNNNASSSPGLLSTQFRPLNRLIGSQISPPDSEQRTGRSNVAEGSSLSAKTVLVHWRLCGQRLWVSVSDIQPLAWPWLIKRPIEIGDSVRVRQSVTVPRYKWGSVTHGSIGTVVALLDDLVYVNFQAQHRWAGLRKELEIIPSEPIVVCYECDSDINVSSDTIYYRCRKCRPPDIYVVCASCRRRLSNSTHVHGLFAFVKTRGSIFTREERGSTSTFRPTTSTSSSAAVPSSAWSSCVATVSASSNGSLLKQPMSGKLMSWASQSGVNPPHWIQLSIKHGVLLQSLCIELDTLRPDSLPSVIVLRIGQSPAHLRTVRTFPVAPDVAMVELLPKPLHKYYSCVEIRIPGTRGGIGAPCRINNLTITPRSSGFTLDSTTAEGDRCNVHDEDESSDSKKSLTVADEDDNDILVLSSSSSESDDDEADEISQAICRTLVSSTTPVVAGQRNQQGPAVPPTVVFGWGLNDKEQLARRGPVKIKQPFIEEPLPLSGLGVVQLAFGSKCSFFLTQNGHLYACGDATNGRLGLGEVSETVSAPRQIGGELAYAFIVKISVHSGGRHALALSVDGRIYSWGDGENGKLGHGDETTQLEPKLIKSLADQSIVVRSISAGSSHSACITSTGELMTWGFGEFGRLGHGDCSNYNVPKVVEAFRGKEVIQVACGSRDAQTLVLTADEMVWSFGDGDFGKLGRGGNESSFLPVVIPDLTGVGVAQVECGAQFSLVRTKCGKVLTFGKGDYYRLGHGTEAHYRRPQRVVGGGMAEEKVTHVAVGALHCLAICASGRVYLWGDGDHFQQGNCAALANRVPTVLQGIPAGYKVIAADCGSSHTGIVCLPPGEKHHRLMDSPTSSSANFRLRSFSSEGFVKPAPMPFAIPFDPLGMSVIGLMPSSTVSDGVVLTNSTINAELKQSLAFRILSKGDGSCKTKSNCASRSNAAFVVHLLRSHIIYRLRSIVIQMAERPDATDVFENYLSRSATVDGCSLLTSFTRLFKLAIAGRMVSCSSLGKELFLPAHVSLTSPIIITLKRAIKNCDSKLLLDAYLPELTNISRVGSVSPKCSPLDVLPAVVQESPHPYAEKSSLSGNVSIAGASSLRITFDSQCSTEKRRDVLSICDYAGRIVSLKSGRDWSSDWSTPEEIIVEGDFISWTFQSDAGSPAGWGFRFFVSCPASSRSHQLASFSDRKIFSLPSLEVISSIIPTASTFTNTDDDDKSTDAVEGRTDRLALFLNALADVTKNGCIAPAYRSWAVSLCSEICLSHKSDQFIERPLTSLANLLAVQYDYEESVVRPGRHLVFSSFCRKLVSLALALRFDRVCPAFEQASWFQRLVQFIGISKSLLERQPWPDWFTSAVNFRIASSSPAPKDRDKDPSVADEFLDNSKFTAIQDEQLVSWYNSGPEEWSLSEAAGWRVFAFGHNHRGQLSLADGPKVKTPSSVPLIEQLEPVQIVGGEQSTFVVSREGRVYAFGYGAGGRLGLGGADSVSVPTLIRSLADIQIVEVVVSSGGKHCLARSIEGQVWSWGDNADGALGHGNRLTYDQPKQVEFFRVLSVTRISAGSAHSAAITADGQLFTWGRGRYGRLGHGDSEDQLLPCAVSGLRDHVVIDVACGSGDAQTLALTADGTVWSFGDGDYGKLGRGGSDGCRVPTAVPTLSDKDVIQVACGSQFSACLTRQGAVYTWGKGEYFRLGQGTTDHVRTPRRVAGLLGKRVIKMAIGSLHCLVLTSDSEVYAFGDNDEGQLGDSSTQPAPRPRLISVLRNRPITHIAAGSAHSFAWTVPSLSISNMATKPAIRYPNGQLPVDCQSLTGIDRLVLRNRLLVFELFSENFWQSVPLLRFSELPDDFPSSPLVTPLSAIRLAPFLLLPHKEATLRRVVQLTTTRDRQHGPVISIDRVSRRAGNGQAVFDQLAAWLPTLLTESSLFLPTRCWKVRFVAESVDDCGGGFSDSIADACEEIQNGLTNAAYLLGGVNTPCSSEPMAIGGEDVASTQHHVVFRPDGKSESLRFLGVLMGIAIRTGSPLSISIVPAMWRLLTITPSLGLSLNDLRELDHTLFTSLREIAQMPDDLLKASDLPFSVPDIFGHLIPLSAPGSPHQSITPANREQFLSAAYSFRQHEFDEALRHIADGLGRVVPLPLLRLFTPAQLEWLVCGSPDVSVDVLKSITSYRGGLDATSSLVRWFWEVVEELRPSERAQLLRFVWGRSRLPRRMSDFRGRDFVIQPLDKFGEAPAADAYLPEASTCFFMLKLPRYSCREVLDGRLRYAISACQSIDLDDYVGATGSSGQMTVTEVLLNNPHHF